MLEAVAFGPHNGERRTGVAVGEVRSKGLRPGPCADRDQMRKQAAGKAFL